MSKKPTQLIIENVVLPATTHDRYLCYPQDIKELLQVADGTQCEEMVGTVQRIVYSYDKMPDETYRAVLRALRGGGEKTVAYLPDDSETGELVTSRFLVESITQPSLQFYLGESPRWHQLGFVLREAEPHA